VLFINRRFVNSTLERMESWDIGKILTLNIEIRPFTYPLFFEL
jgi:hypothetical protein